MDFGNPCGTKSLFSTTYFSACIAFPEYKKTRKRGLPVSHYEIECYTQYLVKLQSLAIIALLHKEFQPIVCLLAVQSTVPPA